LYTIIFTTYYFVSAKNQHQGTKPQHISLENSQYSAVSTQISKILTRRLHICMKVASGKVVRQMNRPLKHMATNRCAKWLESGQLHANRSNSGWKHSGTPLEGAWLDSRPGL